MDRRDSTPTAPKRPAKPKLTASERAVFDEALERGEGVRKTVDAAVVEFGQWLFARVFGEDTTAVLESRDDNELWNAILLVAGGSRLRLAPRIIENAVLCAVYDKRLNSDGWRLLDFTRKSLLLRLEDEELMRDGAQHLIATNLSIEATAVYVREVLRANGDAVQTRVTLRRVESHIERFCERLVDEHFNARLDEVIAEADPAQRRAAIERVTLAQRALGALKSKLNGRKARQLPRKKAKSKSKRRG
ncbi:MAG: hypothetical protein JNK05_36385 [Myxococcales bacterium]|nr:hypothetical protein [Myxococcales bacterium]